MRKGKVQQISKSYYSGVAALQGASGGLTSSTCFKVSEKQRLLDPSIENTLTCYRPPRWPDPEFHETYRKNALRVCNPGPQANTPKISRKYPKNRNTTNAHLGYRMVPLTALLVVQWGSGGFSKASISGQTHFTPQQPPPAPASSFLTRGCCEDPGLEQKTLLRKTLVWQNAVLTVVSRTFSLLLRRTSFPH